MGRKGHSRPVSRTSQSEPDVNSQEHKRQASVYDAVAGRVSSIGFLPKTPIVSKYRDTASSSTIPVPPEEVLFRRSGAPERYEEDDFYWADRHLSDRQLLPGSDLLTAIHAYASDFYSQATTDRGMVDFGSMDGTALMAIGVLLEEFAEHILGDTGDMVFVEGQRKDADGGHGDVSERNGLVRETSAAARKSGDTRRGKRRKIRHEITESD